MVTRIDNYNIKALSTDTKPADAPVNALLLELDTGDFYYYDGTAWEKVGE